LWCRKAYRWIYIERLTPKKKPKPMQVGGIVHDLFLLQFEGKLTEEAIENLNEFVQNHYPANTPGFSTQVAVEAANLFNSYLNHPEYQKDPLTITSPEVHLEYDFGEFILYGRIDALGKTEDGRLWRVERKTAGQMDSFFLQGLKNSLQAGIYDFLLEKNLDAPGHFGTIYDILVKTKVPQFKRNPLPKNKRVIGRSIETVKGVHRDILNCLARPSDFYPSCNCISYNCECDYLPLCNFDSKETREAFYNKIPEERRWFS
jgi:hypothetical protein